MKIFLGFLFILGVTCMGYGEKYKDAFVGSFGMGCAAMGIGCLLYTALQPPNDR